MRLPKQTVLFWLVSAPDYLLISGQRRGEGSEGSTAELKSNQPVDAVVQSTLANWVMLGPGLLSQLSGLVT